MMHSRIVIAEEARFVKAKKMKGRFDGGGGKRDRGIAGEAYQEDQRIEKRALTRRRFVKTSAAVGAAVVGIPFTLADIIELALKEERDVLRFSQARVFFAPSFITLSPGQVATIMIKIYYVEDLAGVDFWLEYDSDVAEILQIQTANFGGLHYTSTWRANRDNRMKINWADMANPKTGAYLTYARITFRTVGSPGQETTLQLDVKNLANSDFEEIGRNVYDGVIRIE